MSWLERKVQNYARRRARSAGRQLAHAVLEAIFDAADESGDPAEEVEDIFPIALAAAKEGDPELLRLWSLCFSAGLAGQADLADRLSEPEFDLEELYCAARRDSWFLRTFDAAICTQSWDLLWTVWDCSANGRSLRLNTLLVDAHDQLLGVTAESKEFRELYIDSRSPSRLSRLVELSPIALIGLAAIMGCVAGLVVVLLIAIVG